MGKKPQIKTRTVDAQSTASWFFRPFYKKSLESIINDEAKKGWRLTNNTPVAGRGGQTVKYILTFEKD